MFGKPIEAFATKSDGKSFATHLITNCVLIYPTNKIHVCFIFQKKILYYMLRLPPLITTESSFMIQFVFCSPGFLY